MNHDDIPIGSHLKPMPAEFLEEQKSENPEQTVSVTNLELTERLLHKQWKVRLDAFTELKQIFEKTDTQLETYQKYAELFKKYVTDSHPGVQEKCLETLMILVQKNNGICTPFIEELFTNLLEKCMSSMKQNIKEKAINVALEISNNPEIREKIVAKIIADFPKFKLPKIISAVLNILSEYLHKFNKDAYKFENLSDSLEKYAANSNNSNVRNDAIQLYKTACEICGTDIIMPFISKLKQTQQDEILKTSCDPSKVKSPCKKLELLKTPPNNEEKPAEKPSQNLFDFLTQASALKKWSEKRDKLEEAYKILQGGDKDFIKISADFVTILKTLMNDNNSVVSQCTLKILEYLIGIDDFQSFCKMLIKPIFMKLKDKKAEKDANKCLIKLAPIIKLSEIIEDLKSAFSEKSPTLKIQLSQWLDKSLLLPNSLKNYEDMLDLIPLFLPLLDDANSEIREISFQIIGIISTINKNDLNLQKTLSNLNQQKQDKIKEISENISKRPELLEFKYPSKISTPIKASLSPRQQLEKIKTPTHKNQPIKKSEKPIPRPKTSMPVQNKSSTKTLQKIQQKAVSEQNVMKNNSEEIKICEEDAEKIVKENLIPAEINEKLCKTEWKERQKGFQDLLSWLNENKSKIDEILIPLSLYLKSKLKDFKESNQTIIKEAFSIILVLSESNNTGKKFTQILIPGIIEKMSDNKWYEQGMQILLNSADCSTPNFVVQKIIETSENSSKNINLLKSNISIIQKFITEYEFSLLPLKEIVNFTKNCLNNSNSAIRQNATTLIGKIYEIVGEPLKSLLSDLKEAMLKTVESELSKIQPNSIPSNQKRNLRGEALNSEKIVKNEKNNKDAIDQLIPRIDISSQITEKLLEKIQSSTIKIRQGAKDELFEILKNANNRIQSSGLSNLTNCIKNRMNEPCKTLLKHFITFIGELAIATGSGFKQYAKILLAPLISNLGDKQSYIKSETLASIQKIHENIGPELIISSMVTILEKDCFEIRSESLKYILKNKDSIKLAENTEIIKGIICCLQDKNKEIRENSEKLFEFILLKTGIEPFLEGIKDLKPTVQSTLSKIFNNYSKTQLPTEAPVSENKPKIQSKPKKIIPPSKIIPKKPEIKESPCKSTGGSSTNAQKVEQIFIGAIMNTKEKRMDQKNAKIPEINPEYIEKLKKTLKINMHPLLIEMMFSNKLKTQLEAIKIFYEQVKSNSEIPGIIDSLDLIFKWLGILLNDQSNTAIYKAILDFLTILFGVLQNEKYLFSDFEASLIFPLLCDLLGTVNSQLRPDIKNMLIQCLNIYPPIKLTNFLIRALDSKYQHTKLECLNLIKSIILQHGIKVITARDIKSFGKIFNQVTDTQIKNECLELIAEIYKIKGETVWSSFGESLFTEKNKEIILAKFKQLKIAEIRPKTGQIESKKIDITPEINKENEKNLEKIKTPIKNKIIPTEISIKSVEKPKEKSVKKAIENLDSKISNISECLNILLDHEISKRVDALVFLNEKLASDSQFLDKSLDFSIENINKILCVFSKVLHSIFTDYTQAEFPARFAKYFLTILNKFCAMRCLIQQANSDSMNSLIFEVLSNLLYPGLEKLGENCEGENLMKSMNSCMLFLLEKSNPNIIFNVLINLYQNTENLIDKIPAKLPDLIVKCLLKLTKVLDSLIPMLDITELLKNIQKYLDFVNLKQNAHTEIGTRVVKTIVNELVKSKKENIWEFYNKMENSLSEKPQEETKIKRWITLMLSNIPTFNKQNEKSEIKNDFNNYQNELKEIFMGLNSKETFDLSIRKLAEYKKSHPEIDLSKYFQSCSKTFTDHVMNLLEKCMTNKNEQVLGIF